MITLTDHRAMHSSKYPDHMLTDLCLQVAGGGWTTAQTAKAMTIQAQLNRTGTASLRRNGGKITITMTPDTDEGDAFDMAYEDQCAAACGPGL